MKVHKGFQNSKMHLFSAEKEKPSVFTITMKCKHIYARDNARHGVCISEIKHDQGDNRSTTRNGLGLGLREQCHDPGSKHGIYDSYRQSMALLVHVQTLKTITITELLVEFLRKL